MKFKPPRALFVFIICLIGVAYFGYGIYERRIATSNPSPDAIPQTEAVQSANTVPAQQSSQTTRSPLSESDYLALRTPRLPDVPSSAPIYDEVTRPVTYPKLSCMHTADTELIERNHKRFVVGFREGRLYGCRCNTQQGTRAVVSFDGCMAYVQIGRAHV